MKKGILLLIVIVLILGVAGFLYYVQYGNDVSVLKKVKAIFLGIGDGDDEDERLSGESSGGSDSIDGSSGSSGSGSGGGSGSGSGGDSGSGSGSEDGESRSVRIEEDVGINYGVELPVDLYTAPCGFYFAEYGICAGVCPGGACILEGGSCYCKKV